MNNEKGGSGFKILGTVILIVVIAICIPLTVPKFMGYQIYAVISGSMEPAIKTGSMVYVTPMEPVDVQEGDVIAFYGASDSGAIITHRVVSNNYVEGEITTKGDANADQDPVPVDYNHFIGKVDKAIPVMGTIMSMVTTVPGKAGAVCLIVLSIIFHIIGGKKDKEADEEEVDSKEKGNGEK